MTTPDDMFEELIQQLLKHNFGVIDHFIPEEIVSALRINLQTRLEAGQMKQAGVGQQTSFQKNENIRRDLISWIEEEYADPAEKSYLSHVKDFMQYLNRTCFTGLRELESHYAWYDTGSFYKKHIDQFKSDSGRKFSIVTYLNENWIAGDGGQLILYNNGEQKIIEPFGGRIVFFESHKLEHEVLVANKPRMSIAGWMKSF